MTWFVFSFRDGGDVRAELEEFQERNAALKFASDVCAVMAKHSPSVSCHVAEVVDDHRLWSLGTVHMADTGPVFEPDDVRKSAAG